MPVPQAETELAARQLETLVDELGVTALADHAAAEGCVVELSGPGVAHQVEHVLRLAWGVRLQPFDEQILYLERQAQHHVAGAGPACLRRRGENALDFGIGQNRNDRSD